MYICLKNEQMKYLVITISLALPVLLFSCSGRIPENAISHDKDAVVYPDYTGLVIPYNIAPLNFHIQEDADEYLTVLYASNSEKHIISGKKVQFPLKKWKKLLETNRGDTLYTDIYLRKSKQWLKCPSIKNFIATDEIDRYLSYRLIEPSYVTYEQLTINQRDLTGFSEKVIFSNQLLAGKTDEEGQCINCHSFRNYNRTGDMQFHVRQYLGGTVIVSGDSILKVNLKTDYTISAGVYPSWHPALNLIAYSTNNTGQNFHTRSNEKIEVMDSESDLILYDMDKNEVSNIAADPDRLETFPSWSRDGKYLYYASAAYPSGINKDSKDLYLRYNEFYYNIYRKTFDAGTREFTATDTIFDAAKSGKSATFPRESPDGKYLLFTSGDYGNFHIWHKNSDLYLIDMESATVTAMKELNSSDTESYHSWSSNGHWIVFSSRRDDGSYTRPYIAYFNDGKASKPFILPQRDPDFYGAFFKSYNIPEFMTEPVNVSPRQLANAIQKDANKVIFNNNKENPDEKQEKDGKENFYE
jgi:hypothetical protein